MKLGSLFDGAGTCPYAASLCGITPVWASEIEDFPIAVSSSNFPRMLHLGDILKINGAEIEPVDVITFGSPCQDVSQAGKRAGLKHEAKGDDETTRSGLFLEAVRIFREMRCATHGQFPQICIWENVPGAFSSNKGEDFYTVLEEMCGIPEPGVSIPRPPSRGGRLRWSPAGEIVGDGYSLAWRTLDAKYWGVPQRRSRIFLVLDLRGECAGEICFKREGLSRDFKTVRGKGQTHGPAPEECPGTSGGTPPPPAFGFKAGQSPSAGGLGWEKEVAQTLGANMSGLEPTVCCYAVESHPMDSRVKLSEDGLVQTLAARMGTGGGGTRLSSSSTVPTTTVRRICPRRSKCHAGDTSDISNPQLGVGRSFRRVQFGWFVPDSITGTLRTWEGRDPSTIIMSPKGGNP